MVWSATGWNKQSGRRSYNDYLRLAVGGVSRQCARTLMIVGFVARAFHCCGANCPSGDRRDLLLLLQRLLPHRSRVHAAFLQQLSRCKENDGSPTVP